MVVGNGDRNQTKGCGEKAKCIGHETGKEAGERSEPYLYSGIKGACYTQQCMEGRRTVSEKPFRMSAAPE